MCHIPKTSDPNLLVGIDTSDDASVYQLNDHTALIQTIDFFTPIVDDPYDFGQIAAANALSDVYAMGGDPSLAMNIICFPKSLPPEYAQKILLGGYDKVTEAGAIITGGHSIEDAEPKYGLSVTGFLSPQKVLTNCNAQNGDVLVLTKPLGSGIITTAMKSDLVDLKVQEKIIKTMKTLNKIPKDAMTSVGAHSCTDITGFGLIGHAMEMASGSHVTLRIHASQIPIIQEAIQLAEMGIVPAGAYNNRSYLECKTQFDSNVPQSMEDCLFDPQTSGGLLISVAENKANALLDALKCNKTEYAVIGEVIEKKDYPIIVMS